MPRDDVLPQHVVEQEGEGRREHRDHAHDHDRCEPAVAAGRLGIATRPETGEREHERREPERLEREDVDDEAAREAEDRAGHGAAQQPERHDDDQEQVGRTRTDDDGRDDDRLKHRGDEQHERAAEACVRRHRGRSDGTSTMTAYSAPKST